jgi:hypothetical protein
MHDLSLYLLEMIENSLRAGAGAVAVRVEITPERDELAILVEDDGPGLDVSPAQAADPFFTTKSGKKTGLGLPLFREAAEAAGGHLVLRRSAGLGGLAIEAVMRLSHVDRPPLGDVVQTMAATNPQAALTLEVGAGPDSCIASGAELVADGAGVERCAAILAGADQSPGLTSPDAASASAHTNQPVDDTVDVRTRRRSVG